MNDLFVPIMMGVLAVLVIIGLSLAHAKLDQIIKLLEARAPEKDVSP